MRVRIQALLEQQAGIKASVLNHTGTKSVDGENLGFVEPQKGPF